MITIDKLREYGADVDDGLKRCMNAEGFYLELVQSVISDTRIDELEKSLAAHDLDSAFEIAHALKGMYGNLALTPIYEPIHEMTELLRSRTDTDYSALLSAAKQKKAELDAL